MQSTAGNLEFKLNVNLRLVKPDFMQSTAANLELNSRLSLNFCHAIGPKRTVRGLNIRFHVLTFAKPKCDNVLQGMKLSAAVY